MYILSFSRKKIVECLHIAFMVIVLFFISKKHFLLLHTTAEIATVVLALY